MEKKEKITNTACSFVALSILEYYWMVTQKFLDGMLYIKALIFELLPQKPCNVGILRKMERILQNTLNTLYNTGQYILLITMNLCFGMVILFLIVKHVLQNINIYKPKYYTLAIF